MGRLFLVAARFQHARILLEETEYERLCRVAGESVADDDALPPFPSPDKSGRFPALEYTRISIARNLIRDRKALGLSQQRLAELANVRQETVSRIESGKHTASTKTIGRIDWAIAGERTRQLRKRKSRS